MRWTTTDRIDETNATTVIEDGRLTIEAEPAHDGSELLVDGRRNPPLGASEAHVRLRVVSDDARTTVELDADQADALRDALDSALTWEGE